MRFLLFCLLLACGAPTPAARAADKDEAVRELLRAFGAEKGELSRLLEVRYAVNGALFNEAMRSVESGDFPVWGDSGALVVEFSDYQCGYCKRMFPLLQNAVEEGEARVLIVELPILGPLSEKAARYALAARRQGKYDDFHRFLMSGGRLSEEVLDLTVDELGLDAQQLQADENADAVNETLNRGLQLAFLLGVSSTPTFVIDGALLKGALPEEDFRRLLSDAGE